MKPVVRIAGLVRLAEQVRGEIGRGLGKGHKRQIQETVSRAVAQVDQILRQRRGQLAAPSRRAYQFLSGLRWEEIAENENAPPKPSQGALRWSGLGAFAERMMARLGEPGVTERELAEVGEALAKMSRRIEASIARTAVGPEGLSAATREWRAWFAWLAEGENIKEYVAAVSRSRIAIERAARAASNESAIITEFRPTRHIYKMRTRAGKAKITLPTPMVRFDEPGFADLGELIFMRDRESKRRVVQRMRDEAYLDVMAELEALGGVVDGTRGAFHDLAESFERVNVKCFGGTMERPKLTWSRSFTGRKFGHYDHLKDWVMVSSTLDQPQVPALVVDYLMFHELLHKKHGVRWVNGRGYAHTAAFYADERRFERYDKAEAWLNKLARK